MIKIRVIALIGSLVFLYSAIAMGAPKGHKGKQAKKADKQEVTYLDLSTPDKPTSDFPDVVKKGPL